MRIQIERLLAGTALAVTLAMCGQLNPAQAQAPAAATNNGVPMPEPANVPPPSIKDVQPGAKPAEAAPVQAEPVQAAPVPVQAAPVQTATPAPAAAIADSAVADKLRDVLPSKLDRAFNRRSDRAAVEAFYKKRNFAPLWVADGAANAKAKAAIDYLAHVDRDGLEPSEYPTPDFKTADTDGLADGEIRLTAAALNYAHHALRGRVHYSRIASDIAFTHDIDGADDVLAKLAAGSDAAATLDGFQPQHAPYKALKQALADVRAGKYEQKKDVAPAKPSVKIAGGKILRPGMKDDRVIALRKRLDIKTNPDSNAYDTDMSDAVAKFQKDANIGVDGNLGPNTVAALNGEASTPVAKLADPVDIIVANLDRWRWYQRDLGSRHVIVNIPDYRLTIYKDETVYWTTKIVVGKPSQATPLITAEMKFITVNPTWNVPPSIIQNEYLPALQEDPQALDRIGLKVEQAADGTVRIFQPPGAANALGRIRFNFPNKFLVYQHDTPDKHLFARDRRAFSHGCMRVENPLTYGEKILSLALPGENYTSARLEKMFGGSEININFPNTIPVHLTYQSAFVDADGKLQLREDIYGRDARMIALMKGSERKVADIGIERPPNSSAKPVKLAPGSLGLGGSFNSGPSFFDLLFGGPSRAAEPAAPVRRNRDRRASAR